MGKAARGDSGPPCGVPSVTAIFVPSGITTPAVSIRRTFDRVHHQRLLDRIAQRVSDRRLR
jgi:hypothetical protein